MAGPHTRHNPVSVREDELIGDVPTEGSNTPIPSSAQIPAPAYAPAPAPRLPNMYTDIDL